MARWLNRMKYKGKSPVLAGSTSGPNKKMIYNGLDIHEFIPQSQSAFLDPQIDSMWNYGDSSQGYASWTLNNLLDSPIYQYNFLDTELCGTELDSFDYSNARFICQYNLLNTTILSDKLSELLTQSQIESLRNAIVTAETTANTYDDNVRNAIINWWINNTDYMWWSYDAWGGVMNRKQRGFSIKCDIVCQSTDGSTEYTLDDSSFFGGTPIGYNTILKLNCGNDSYNYARLCCWKSLAIIFYNVYYLKQ